MEWVGVKWSDFSVPLFLTRNGGERLKLQPSTIQVLVLSKLGVSLSTSYLYVRAQMLRQHPQILALSPEAGLGALGSPSPRPWFLPSSQPGKLVLVPSKRMRREAAHFLLLKLARLTPNALSRTQWPSIWKTLPKPSLTLPLEAGQKQKHQAQGAQGLCLS